MAVAGAAPYVLDAMGSGVDLNQAHKPRAIHGGQLYEIADAQLLGWDLAANNGIVPCFEQPSSNRRGDCPVAEAKNLALSAWELDCLGSLTSKLQVSPPPLLSVSARRVPVLTLPAGAQRARSSSWHDHPAGRQGPEVAGGDPVLGNSAQRAYELGKRSCWP